MFIPESWKEIDKDFCKELASKFAYAKELNEQQEIIAVFELEADYKEVVNETKETLNQIKKENRIVDGDPNKKDYHSTAIIIPIYFDEINVGENKIFLNISNHVILDVAEYAISDEKYKTAGQIVFVKDKKTYIIQFPLNYLKETENDINHKLIDDETFNEVLQYLNEF